MFMVRVIAIRCGLVIALCFFVLIVFSTGSVSFGAPQNPGQGADSSKAWVAPDPATIPEGPLGDLELPHVEGRGRDGNHRPESRSAQAGPRASAAAGHERRCGHAGLQGEVDVSADRRGGEIRLLVSRQVIEHDWEESYQGIPPWDIGRPQPNFAALTLTGRVIDVGCGTGEHTLLSAAQGADALGIDISARAIDKARAKARDRGLQARFEVFDALELPSRDERFEIALDSGVYHVFHTADLRARYAGGVRSVLDPGATLYLQCFSDRTAGDWGPQRIGEEELRATFSDGWELVSLEPATFETNAGMVPVDIVHAWFLVARRD
jgi:SAM-dependent methyltransferase